MCAPIGWLKVGLSARTREYGALLERWRAQCSLTASTVQDPAIARISRDFVRNLVSWANRAGVESDCGQHQRTFDINNVAL